MARETMTQSETRARTNWQQKPENAAESRWHGRCPLTLQRRHTWGALDQHIGQLSQHQHNPQPVRHHRRRQHLRGSSRVRQDFLTLSGPSLVRAQPASMCRATFRVSTSMPHDPTWARVRQKRFATRHAATEKPPKPAQTLAAVLAPPLAALEALWAPPVVHSQALRLQSQAARQSSSSLMSSKARFVVSVRSSIRSQRYLDDEAWSSAAAGVRSR